MERAAFQRHLPSEQHAEEEYRKKKIASSVLLALGRRLIASRIWLVVGSRETTSRKTKQ